MKRRDEEHAEIYQLVDRLEDSALRGRWPEYHALVDQIDDARIRKVLYIVILDYVGPGPDLLVESR